ncbi:MAG TPA: thioredoxin domain-containing protein, partial [Isosphaeraceae bacterium]|nr:thioredoxin domain-containing protein [Isosphaeraceae bacterium]
MTASAAERPANRLIGETSPYLLQHAQNPVDWYPWGPEAIARAKAEDKPIFLSIGYSACHWCHVMEHESFEDPEIAALMNERFVNIKVDREERPDLDQIYMAAVQAFQDGHGGWPMSVFLTPDLKPFYGGTYYPPTDSRGMPGFPRVLRELDRAWRERRDDVDRIASGMTERLQASGLAAPSRGELTAKPLDQAARELARAFDPIHGGFLPAPKFPHPMDLRLLLRQHARTGDSHALHIVRQTLDKMARGGIYDHLGGGFARYSTDERWLVPHFEKMLYDNALLASTYLEAYQATGDAEYARIARETMDYVLGRMTSPEGGIYSTEDADSEGQEGKYYVWTLVEVKGALGPDRAKTFAYVYDVTEGGNWEHKNILNLPKPIATSAKLLGKDEATL